MKKYCKKLSVLLFFFVISISSVFAYNYTDSFPRSKAIDPPGGLIPEQCPMFVSIGFDDNGDSTGMKWTLDYFRPLTNPVGDGNPGTFDGTPARVTFFVSAYYADPDYIDPDYPDHATGARLNQTQWQNALHDGHEMANHTYEHPHGRAFTVAEWIDEIAKAEAWYQKPEAQGGLGLARTQGFRTPFLEFNQNTFEALKQMGFTYDCSIEDPFDDYAADPRYYPWPYTLDEGTPQNSIAPIKGLWELPVHPLHNAAGKKMTGFDWNVWKDAKTGGDYLDYLKASLDLRMQGNRHPFMVGAHSDYYSPYWEESSVPVAERRQAIVDFINYAQSLEYNGKKVVRIVPFIKIIEWMRNPQPLFWVIKTDMLGEPEWEQRSQATVPANYDEGDRVLYQGQEYICKWWTTARPSPVPGPNNAWRLLKKGEPSGLTYNGTISWLDESSPTGVQKDLAPKGWVGADKGQSRTLFFTPKPGYAVKRVVIDSVDMGAITSYTFNNIQSNHEVSVEWQVSTAPVAITPVVVNPAGGSMNPSAVTTVEKGSSQKIFVNPNRGYDIKSVTLTDSLGTQILTTNEPGVYSIGPVVEATTITAEFVALPSYVVSLNAGIGGTTAPAPAAPPALGHIVYQGEDFEFEVMPDLGYAVDSVKIDNVIVPPTPDNVYKITNIQANTSVDVTFIKKPIYDIAVAVNDPLGGSISPAGPLVQVTEGENQTFNLTVNEGYTVEVLINKIPEVLEANNTFTLTNVSANQTVDVNFTAIPKYTMSSSVIGASPTSSGFGRIVPSGDVSVYGGKDQVFSFIPEKGYFVKEIWVNGVKLPGVRNSHTFKNVSANGKVEVLFGERPIPPKEYIVDASEINNWDLSFSGNVTIDNTSSKDMTNWSYVMTVPAGTTISGWNAVITHDKTNNTVTVAPEAWTSKTIPAKGSVSFGVQGKAVGPAFDRSFLENGKLISGGGTVLPPKHVGLRSSFYGAEADGGFPTPQQWKDGGDVLNSYVSNSQAQTTMVWIVGVVSSKSGGVMLEMHKPTNIVVKDPLIEFKPEFRDHHVYLKYFSENNIKVMLQIEPGFADVEEAIDILFAEFGHYDCIAGFGVDVEWYLNNGSHNGVNSFVDWATTYKWFKKVDVYGKAKNKEYSFFVKHWLHDKLPQKSEVGTAPGEAELYSRLMYVDDNQMEANFNNFKDRMIEFADHFAPNPVGYQIGYASDWWGQNNGANPAGWFHELMPEWANGVPVEDSDYLTQILCEGLASEMGDKTQEYSIFWVDFTMKKLMPNALK